jgi:Tfp pilus assembly protein PilZ
VTAHDERRRHPRFKVSVPVQLTFATASFPGRLKDVCRDAALVEIPRSLALGDEVAMALALPGTDGPLEVMGHVVRIAPGESGAQDVAVLFTGVAPAAEARIDLFIAQQAQEP